MSETVRDRLIELRKRVNFNFSINFGSCSLKKHLIRDNDKIGKLVESCPTEKEFSNQIGTLAILVEDLDVSVLRLCLKKKYEDKGSFDLLEKFLEENNLRKGNIVKNLRYIKSLRNKAPTYHRGTSNEFLQLLRKLNFKSQFDWNDVWKTCHNLYENSLYELSNRLEEYNIRVEYPREIDEERMKLKKRENIIYLNDILYKYRVLVPTDYKYKMKTLVDYLTAAIIAYDKNLKSINYALRKYVIPLKDKFTEHAEDIYFLKKRRFIRNEFIRQYKIFLFRDDIGIKDEEEFQRYFKHVYASVVAYHSSMTPDWLIRHYWGSSWLDDC